MSALLGNYYEFFYAVKMCFKINNVVHTARLLFIAIPAFISNDCSR